MKEVLDKIKPNKEEQKKFNLVVNDFIKKLNSNLNEAKAVLGGSGAKDTWLSGNHDVDVFVQFNYTKYKNHSMELTQFLDKSLRKTFPKIKLSKLHGSRDYFQLTYQKYDFEIVPIIKITKSEQALNITDVSTLHSIWVNKNAKSMKDDIRLLKQFCKANKLYGAESHIAGFSGYILEILIAHYGSFEKLLKASLKWKTKQVIDPEKHYKNSSMVEFHLNKSKLQSPLIIIDPVDKDRNAAAALSVEKFTSFKRLAKKYLDSPNIKFFEEEEIDLEKLKKKGHLVHLEITALSGKRDVIGMKLLKSFEFLKKELKPFKLKHSDWQWNNKKKADFYFVVKEKELPEFEIRAGPPLKMKDYVKDFKKINKNTFTKNSKLFAKVKIKHRKLVSFVKNSVKDDYFKEKVKEIEKINI